MNQSPVKVSRASTSPIPKKSKPHKYCNGSTLCQTGTLKSMITKISEYSPKNEGDLIEISKGQKSITERQAWNSNEISTPFFESRLAMQESIENNETSQNTQSIALKKPNTNIFKQAKRMTSYDLMQKYIRSRGEPLVHGTTYANSSSQLL